MTPLSVAERQARWRAKRNAAAKASAAERLEALTPEDLAGMTAVDLERLEKACHRVARLALAERKRIASGKRDVTKS
jgi:hypothetical protein